MDSQSARLDRIETKLDRLTEVVGQFSALDTKLEGFDGRMSRFELRLDLIENQTNKHSETFAKNSGRGLIVERAAWVIFAAVVAFLSKIFGG